MENQTSQNESGKTGVDQINHVMNNNRDEIEQFDEVDFKNGSKEINRKITHHDLIHNDMKSAIKIKDSDPLKQLMDNVSKKNIPNNLVLERDIDNLDQDFSSPDSDDLFGSKKVSNVNIKSVNSVNHAKTINNNVSNAHESIRDGDSEVLNGNKRNSDNNSNISSEAHVIQSNTKENNQKNTSQNKIIDGSNNISDGTHPTCNIPNITNGLNQSEHLNQLPNSNLSDMVERVNTLNSKMSPNVVFHTPHTTPLKLKLNSLPVQSHPLDEHALKGEDDYRNEPLDLPNSPVLSKCMDDICLKRYKKSANPLCVQEDQQNSEGQDVGKDSAKEVKATELNCLKTPSTSLESVSLAKSPEFTNNVSAEDYLKKYDDINAQVRAYLNKTQGISDLDELNERTHRYLNTRGSISEELGASNRVTYASDEEDHSQYDTIVSQDCHGVKLVKNPRKPSLPAKPNSLPTDPDRLNKKKLLLPSDLFSGNLLDDDMQSMSDDDLDELLSPSLGDEDLENSILEQLNISDDDIQELSAQEEREESRRWKIAMVNGVEKRIDMKVIEPYKRVLSHGGYLSEGCHNAIIVFSACFLPHHSRADYHYVMDNLFFYVLHTLDQLITEDYVLVYLHGATSRHNMPTFSWLKRCYQMIDRKLKKNLKQLYLVHATFWLKTIVVMSKPFISSKFSKKVQFIVSLNELQEKLPIEEASIPDKVKQYDKIKLSMNQSGQ